MPELMSARGYCAHERCPVWHECLEPGRFPRHGAQPYLTPHGKCGDPLEHWVDVHGDSSGIFRAICRQLVELAEPNPDFPLFRIGLLCGVGIGERPDGHAIVIAAHDTRIRTRARLKS